MSTVRTLVLQQNIHSHIQTYTYISVCNLRPSVYFPQSSFCVFVCLLVYLSRSESVQRAETAGTTAIHTSPAPWTRRTSAECLTTVGTSSSACTSGSTSSCDHHVDVGTQSGTFYRAPPCSCPKNHQTYI